MQKETKIENILQGAMNQLTKFVDVNTVVGKPLRFDDGIDVIPITKVVTGFLNGGGEYGELKILKPDAGYQYCGANSAIVTLKPSGFLVHQNGSVKLLPVSEKPYEKLVDLLGETLENIMEKINEKQM